MPDNWRQWADRHDIDPQQLKKDLPLEWVVAIAAGIHLTEDGEGRTAGLCPFHSDNNPSFHVFGYGERWGCFPCGRSGDLYDFIGEYWELDHFEAKLEKALELKKTFDAEASDWKGIIAKQIPPKPVTVAELGSEVQTALNIIERDTVKPVRDLLTIKGLPIDLEWLKRNWRRGVTARGAGSVLESGRRAGHLQDSKAGSGWLVLTQGRKAHLALRGVAGHWSTGSGRYMAL